uniref:Uncharacterized protein n=1 Tax=Strigops habroptila TaxID=2489341 RepID=A0A672TW44_STRHB
MGLGVGFPARFGALEGSRDLAKVSYLSFLSMCREKEASHWDGGSRMLSSPECFILMRIFWTQSEYAWLVVSPGNAYCWAGEQTRAGFTLFL